MLVLSIFARTLKQTVRSTGRMSIIIFFPIMFICVFAFIFSGENATDNTAISLGVVNNDDDGTLINEWRKYFFNTTKPYSENDTIDPLTHGFGHFFIESLQGNTPLSLSNKSFRVVDFESSDEALKAVRARAVSLVVEIPNDFSVSILSGINSKEFIINKTLLHNTTSLKNTNSSLQMLGDPTYSSFQDALSEVESALSRFESEFYGIELPAGKFSTEFESITSYKLTSFDYFVSGFFTFGMVLTASSIGGLLGEERENRTLDRLKISEVKPVEYLGGVSLTQILTSSIQLAIMFLTAYLLGFKGRGNPVYAFVFGFLTIFPVLGLAFLVSAFVPNGRDANGVIAVLSAPIGFLSGAFLEVPSIPLIPDIVPTGSGELRALDLWDFFPFSSSVSAIQKILLFEQGFEDLASELFFLLLGGIIFFIIGASFFVWRIFNPEK